MWKLQHLVDGNTVDAIRRRGGKPEPRLLGGVRTLWRLKFVLALAAVLLVLVLWNSRNEAREWKQRIEFIKMQVLSDEMSQQEADELIESMIEDAEETDMEGRIP